jgi:hypothetical protein
MREFQRGAGAQLSTDIATRGATIIDLTAASPAAWPV